MNGARVTEIKTNHIILNNSQKINFRYLVGADGSNSITRKFLGLAKEKKIIGIQYIIPTDKYQNVEIHFSSALFHSWYAWIFPHNGFVSIGTGGSSNHIPIKLLKKISINGLLKTTSISAPVSFRRSPLTPILRDFSSTIFF